MRRQILLETMKLPYEIREIVAVAEKIEALGQEIIWENIGDPVAKGETPLAWMKEIVKVAVEEDGSYAYSPTRGVKATREFLASEHNKKSAAKLTADNILFFNGLGDAISNLYGSLHREARVIGPDPTYPTHAAAEAAHANQPPITYKLDPQDGWQIDLVDLEEKLAANEDIVAILLVDPGNPTGVAFRENMLSRVVELAREYDCFIIADSIYDSLRFGDGPKVHITDFLGDVSAIVLKGMSKEIPWPGSRCGWMEFFNTEGDVDFARLQKTLLETKMQEVCSTTLPQMVLPQILLDPHWGDYLAERNERYEARANQLVEILGSVEGLDVVRPNGAYYASIVFSDGVLTDGQTLQIENDEVKAVIEPLLADVPLDKRFTYFLLASKGICVVPLSSGFHSRYYGFRLTLLEPDEEKFKDMLEKIKLATETYLAS